MLTWGVSDRRIWLNDGPTHHRKQSNRPQRSLAFDRYYRPKGRGDPPALPGWH
jgi:GH35 family endo-1,4-beta-xylanase